MEIHRQAVLINKKAAISFFKRVPYYAAPAFLGEFSQYRCDGLNRLPSLLGRLAERMLELGQGQRFNTAFVQRYKEGEFVAPHRDPKSNTGHTLIGIFGDFEGGVSIVEQDPPFLLSHGDVLRLPCTIDGEQGPKHYVTPVTKGTRYALILNTIERS